MSALQNLLGADKVPVDFDSFADRAHDFWLLDFQRRLHGVEPELPLAVVQPACHDDVVKFMRFAHENNLSVVPFGLGSGVCGGATAGANAVVLDLGKMNRIVALNENTLTVTVEPGMNGGAFEAELNARGYSMGHFPQSLHLSSVGGWVATRASGQFSTKYGSIEDMLVSFKAVLADGSTLAPKPVVRASVGPDVKSLIMGSEGTFAVLTEVTYKIHPLPESQTMHSFMFEEFSDGLEAIRKIMRAGWKPALLRLYDAAESKRHFGRSVNGGCMLLILSEGPQALTRVEMSACYDICMETRGWDWGENPVKHWLKKRFEIPNLNELALEKGVVFDTIEVSADWDHVADLYKAVVAALKAVPGVLVASAHSSHSYQQGTCLYFSFAVRKPEWLVRLLLRKLTGGRYQGFNLPEDVAEVERRYNACWTQVMDATLANGGTISHHHGIGKVRLPWVSRELGSALPLLKSIKQALDPKGTLNPGTLFPPDEQPRR